MATKVEVLDAGPCKKKLKIELPAEEVRTEYESSLRELTRAAQVPGFRKGRVPRPRLLKQFGEGLSEEVKAKLVDRTSREALESNSLEPVGQLEVDLEEIEFDPAAALSFEVTVEVKPSFELPEYKGVRLDRPPREPVADEEVDRFLDSVRKRSADLEVVEEGGAAPDDRLTLSASIESEGEVVRQSERVVGFLGEEFLGGLLVRVPRREVEGLRVGEEKEIEVALEDGRKGALKFKLEELKRPRLEPLSDEVARTLGAPDLESLRGKARVRIERERELAEREALEVQLLNRLLSSVSFDLPEGLLERASRARQARDTLLLARLGASKDDLETRGEDIEREAKETSERELRLLLLLERIGQAEGIEAGDEELEEEIYRRASRTGRTPVAVRSELEREGGLDELRGEVLNRKVINFLLSSADIKEGAPEGRSEPVDPARDGPSEGGEA